MIQNISINDLLKSKDNLNIIDIRSIQSYNNNHIPGAINIEASNLVARPSQYLNPLTRYYIYCQKGLTSKKVCQILTNYGFKVTNILGGYEEWILNTEN